MFPLGNAIEKKNNADFKKVLNERKKAEPCFIFFKNFFPKKKKL